MSKFHINFTRNTNNQRNGFSYDAAGNLTNDIGQQFTNDATGQQTASTYTNLQNSYDGDGLRVKKSDTSTLTYYLRSTVLGGQVVAEMSSNGARTREYLYLGGQLLVVRTPSKTGVKSYWVHEDPITKSKRITNNLGTVVSTIEMDPWGADTNRSNNAAFQPRKFTSYERDANGSDEAMFRRSNRWHSRFDQPDPYDGGYNYANPQSFNRYAYAQNDPVNFVDPTGLDPDGVWRTDPATGRPYFIPALAFGLMVNIGGWNSGGGGGNEATPIGPANPWADALPKRLWKLAPQDPVLGGPRIQTCTSPGVLFELTELQKKAKRLAAMAVDDAWEMFQTSFSPWRALFESGATTVIWIVIKHGVVTAVEVGGSAGVGLAVHVATTALFDYIRWMGVAERVSTEAYRQVMNEGVKAIEKKWDVKLPYGAMWPGMRPC